MPRFYFDTHDGQKHLRDETGIDMDSVQHAESEAARGLAEMALELGPIAHLADIAVAVRDDKDRHVFRMKLVFETSRP